MKFMCDLNEINIKVLCLVCKKGMIIDKDIYEKCISMDTDAEFVCEECQKSFVQTVN